MFCKIIFIFKLGILSPISFWNFNIFLYFYKFTTAVLCWTLCIVKFWNKISYTHEIPYILPTFWHTFYKNIPIINTSICCLTFAKIHGDTFKSFCKWLKRYLVAYFRFYFSPWHTGSELFHTSYSLLHKHPCLDKQSWGPSWFDVLNISVHCHFFYIA